MSDTVTCETITCCPDDPFIYRSQTASDAGGAVDTLHDIGQPNPNCPVGYHWNGVTCVPD
jgi:hypothetical protein